MPTMNVSLTTRLADFIEGEVAGGDYATASDVVGDALRLLEREKEVEQEKLEILRREIDIGIADADAGRLSKRTALDIARSISGGGD